MLNILYIYLVRIVSFYRSLWLNNKYCLRKKAVMTVPFLGQARPLLGIVFLIYIIFFTATLNLPYILCLNNKIKKVEVFLNI
jgi:hypothetical protein